MVKKTKEADFDVLKDVPVQTFGGRKSLYDLCVGVGVKNRVVYFAMVEKKLPQKQRSLGNVYHVKRENLSYGFILNDGFQIKHVERKHYNMFKDKEVIEIQERK